MYRRLLLAVTALTVAGCAGSGGAIADPRETAAPPLSGSPAADDDGGDFVRTESSDDPVGSGAAAPTTEFDLAAQPTTPDIPVVAETGIPGIDSGDAFCRGWSEFAGSFQAAGLVSAIGNPANAFRVEVFAAPTVVAAVQSLEANLPAELEVERVSLVADFAGPFFVRASAAEALLDEDIRDDLVTAWIDQLTAAGLDDPFIEVELPAAVGPVSFAAAVEAFGSAFPPIVDDPSLITDVQIPLTEAYLAGNCPDGGILSGNDVIADG